MDPNPAPPAQPALDSDTVHPIVDRLAALLAVAVGGWLIWALLWVDPDPRGFGTHEQLGMLPCGWPAISGIPCPTCGVTTSAAHMLHLQPLAAVAAQPFGAALTLFGLWLWGRALLALVRGRPFVMGLVFLPYGTILVVGTGLLLVSWLYKYLTFSP